MLNIVVDIERVGDYTKNIYDLAVHHPEKLLCGANENEVIKIEAAAKDFLNQTIDAFKSQNTESARKLMQEYKTDISAVSIQIVDGILSGKNQNFPSQESAALCLYARYLKRIAAHSRNLVSSIVNPFERIGYPE